MATTNKPRMTKACSKCKRRGWHINKDTGEVLCSRCKEGAKTLEIEPSPDKLVPLGVNVSQKQSLYRTLLDFLDYRNRLADEVTVITTADGYAHAITGSDRSRYFPGGRKKMQRNIKKRLGTRWFSPGVLFTGTYDPNRFTKYEAWGRISEDRKRLLHALNMRLFRKRGKYGSSLKDLWAVEEIPKNHADKKTGKIVYNTAHGYPHVHIFFPGLRWLASTEVLNELWSVGLCDVVYKDNINCASYLCKYISKLDDWTDYSQMLIWSLRKRVYGYTACYRLPDFSEKVKSDSSYGGTFITKNKYRILESYILGNYKIGNGWDKKHLYPGYDPTMSLN